MAYNTLGSNVGQYFDWPKFEPWWTYVNQGNSFHRHILNAQYYRVGMQFQAPKTGSISHIGTYVLYVDAADRGVDCVIQALDLATGFPDGTDLGVRGTALLGTGDIGNWFSGALDTAAPVTQGNMYAAFFEKTDAAGRVDLAPDWSLGNLIPLFPYYIQDTSGAASPTWFGHSSYTPFNVEIRYDDGSYAHIGETFPCVYANRDWPALGGVDRWGVQFTSPGNWRVRGVWTRGQLKGVDPTFRITDVATETDHDLYALDGSVIVGSNNRITTRWICEEGDEFDMKAGVEYYLTSDAGNLSALEGPSSGYSNWFDMYCQGAGVQAITRNSTTGVYSVKNDYQMPMIGLMIDAVSPVQPGINIPLIAAS